MNHNGRSLMTVAAVAAAVLGLAGCGGDSCSGFRGSLAQCDDFGDQCMCNNASTDTCITASMFTDNGWTVPTQCTPPNATYDCADPVNGPRPCCPGYTCVAACNAGACSGEYPGCVGSACIKMGSTVTPGGQCMAERFTCSNPNTQSPSGCLNAVLCCGSDGMCNICLGGSCGSGGKTFGPCTQGSCDNSVAAFTNYCCGTVPDGGTTTMPCTAATCAAGCCYNGQCIGQGGGCATGTYCVGGGGSACSPCGGADQPCCPNANLCVSGCCWGGACRQQGQACGTSGKICNNGNCT
jgi:hypothetical protein